MIEWETGDIVAFDAGREFISLPRMVRYTEKYQMIIPVGECYDDGSFDTLDRTLKVPSETSRKGLLYKSASEMLKEYGYD